MAIATFDRIWFLTWTTYGTWLPGDERGFVSPKFDGDKPEGRNNIPGTDYDTGRPGLRQIAQAKLAGPPVWLTHEHAVRLRAQFEETAGFRGWTILAGAIIANHVHLVVGVMGDPEPSDLMRDFKSYGSRALNRAFVRPESGTWWTEQGSNRKVKDSDHLAAVLRYVREQLGALEIWESPVGERGA